MKSIFYISTLWGIEVASAGIILTSCHIGSLELELVSAVTVYCHRLLLPFQRSIFGANGNKRNLDQLVVPEPSGRKTLDFSAVVPHSLILLWRRNRWRKEIHIDFDWILCFVILKGHNYFHCEVFMIQQNCFLAKHNRFEACLIVVCCFHFCLFYRRVFCITSVSIIYIFLMLFNYYYYDDSD